MTKKATNRRKMFAACILLTTCFLEKTGAYVTDNVETVVAYPDLALEFQVDIKSKWSQNIFRIPDYGTSNDGECVDISMHANKSNKIKATWTATQTFAEILLMVPEGIDATGDISVKIVGITGAETLCATVPSTSSSRFTCKG